MEYTLDPNVWNKFVGDKMTAAKKLEASLEIIEQVYPVKDAVEQQTERLSDLKEKLYSGGIKEVLQRSDLTDKEKEIVKRALTRQFAGKPEELSRLASVTADPELKVFIQQLVKEAEEQESQRQENLGLKPEMVAA
jgi:hypothetical protein